MQKIAEEQVAVEEDVNKKKHMMLTSSMMDMQSLPLLVNVYEDDGYREGRAHVFILYKYTLCFMLMSKLYVMDSV